MAPTESADRTPAAPGEALGAVLAGGRGSRLGGTKPTVELAGRPLISYPLAALAAAGIEAFVVAKPDTDLPAFVARPSASGPADFGADRPTDDPAASIAGRRSRALAREDFDLVTEPADPSHPLAGIVAALRHARRPLVVLGCDFPFAPPPLLRALADAPEPLVVPAPGGDAQPLIARWSPELLPRLEAALDREEPLRRTVAGLGPRMLGDGELARFGDPARAFFNVNTPADLRAATRLL